MFHNFSPHDGLIFLQLRDTLIGEDTDYAAQQRARLDRRAAEEEELMTRVPLRKKELANLKAAHRVGMSGGALLDDFADDISKLFQACLHRLRHHASAHLCHANNCSGDPHRLLL